jgi:hypothetical protein
MKKTLQCNLHPAYEMAPVIVRHRTETDTNALPAWRCTHPDCALHFEQMKAILTRVRMAELSLIRPPRIAWMTKLPCNFRGSKTTRTNTFATYAATQRNTRL